MKVVKFTFCTVGNTVKMAISTDFDMLTDIYRDIESNFEEIL